MFAGGDVSSRRCFFKSPGAIKIFQRLAKE